MMIKPTKYTDIDFSIIGISTEILNILSTDKIQKYDRILGKIKYKKDKKSVENFLLALSFLYTLGKIKYYPKEDLIELLN